MKHSNSMVRTVLKLEKVPVRSRYAAQQFSWSGLSKAFKVDTKGACNRSTGSLGARRLYQKSALIDALEEVSVIKYRGTVLNNEWARKL